MPTQKAGLRYANRTPWSEASREVPAAWLEDEARNSTSPYSLLASWKGSRGGVPSHVMIKMLRRRLREYAPDAVRAAAPPARLQRAQDMLAEIWERAGAAGERHPVWRLVEGLLKMALDRSATVPAANDRSSRSKPVDGGGVPA
jgi:hypothetical protein